VWEESSKFAPFEKVALLGTGLMGGSLGMALRERRLAREVWGYNRSEASLVEAREKGAVDHYSLSIKEVVEGADLVVLSVPIRYCRELAEASAPYLSPGALVTDLGSTKSYLMDRISGVIPEHACYVGGHPMTGSEQSGISAAEPTLWENAVYVLTPSSDAPDFHVENLKWMVEKIGAQPLFLSPGKHDRMVALTSHLPHLVAVALVQVAAGENNGDLLRSLAAGGFRDTTRVAMGSPEVWKDICITNGEAIADGLEKAVDVLQEMRQIMLEEKEEHLGSILQEASEYRKSIPYRARSIFPEIFEVIVLVKDHPGVIGRVATLLGEKGINIAEIEILHVREEEGGTMRLGFQDKEQRDLALELLKETGYRAHRR